MVRQLRADLTAALAALAVHAGWDTREVTVMGFSDGGAVALDLAVHGGALLGGAVAISGGPLLDVLAEEPVPLHPTPPILITHGDRDDRVPLAAALDRAAALRRALPVDDDRRRLDVYTVPGKAHTMLGNEGGVGVRGEGVGGWGGVGGWERAGNPAQFSHRACARLDNSPRFLTGPAPALITRPVFSPALRPP